MATWQFRTVEITQVLPLDQQYREIAHQQLDPKAGPLTAEQQRRCSLYQIMNRELGRAIRDIQASRPRRTNLWAWPRMKNDSLAQLA